MHAQGKPRLRKFQSHNRNKLHLPQLVMAIAGLPEPARSTATTVVTFPLENRAFVIEELVFNVLDDDGVRVVLAPLRVSVRYTEFTVDLVDRLNAIANDMQSVDKIHHYDQTLAEAIRQHVHEVRRGINTQAIRKAANRVISLKRDLFGPTNFGSASKVIEASERRSVQLEAVAGIEGRILTRIHVYKERDQNFARQVREYHLSHSGGVLACESCAFVPRQTYGVAGNRCIELHHKVPIAELQPDSVTTIDDMALVCASCHRVVHSRTPCYTIEEMRTMIALSDDGNVPASNQEGHGVS